MEAKMDYPCPNCPATFTNGQALIDHEMLEHTPTKKPPIPAPMDGLIIEKGSLEPIDLPYHTELRDDYNTDQRDEEEER